MNPTLKPQVDIFKGKIAYVDNSATDTAFIDPSFYLDSPEITDTGLFSNDSNVTSIDSATFDSSDASSIMDSSVFVDCSI